MIVVDQQDHPIRRYMHLSLIHIFNAGVPEQEIEFIHNADTENKKAELFSKVRLSLIHISVMRYTLFPESEEDISICDCCDGDKPMEIAVEGDTFTPETQNLSLIHI